MSQCRPRHLVPLWGFVSEGFDEAKGKLCITSSHDLATFPCPELEVIWTISPLYVIKLQSDLANMDKHLAKFKD